METETNTVNVELPEEATETKKKKKSIAKETKPEETQKKLIVQVPADVSDDYVEFLENKLKSILPELVLDNSEIRKLKPDKGGRTKKYLSAEDEKEHYKQYFKDYYQEKLAKTGTCQYCNKEFKTYTSIARHVKRSKHCLAMRQQREAILQDIMTNDNGVASATPTGARSDAENMQLRNDGPTHPTGCNVPGLQEKQNDTETEKN